MKLAPPILVPGPREIPQFSDEPPRHGGRRFATVVITLLLSAVLWYGVIEPAAAKVAAPAVRVPRVQQVVFLEADSTLQVGDTVIVSGGLAPIPGKIAAVPRQLVKDRDKNGREFLLIVGSNRYYVVAANGIGQIVKRTDIRRLVHEATVASN
jgi:hypothetical protein